MMFVCSTLRMPSTASSRKVALLARKLPCSTRERTSRTSVLMRCWFSLRTAFAFSAETKVRMRVSPSSVSEVRVVTSPTWPSVIKADFRSRSFCVTFCPDRAVRKALWLARSMSPPVRSRMSASRSTICSNRCSITASGLASSSCGVFWQRAPNTAKALGVTYRTVISVVGERTKVMGVEP